MKNKFKITIRRDSPTNWVVRLLHENDEVFIKTRLKDKLEAIKYANQLKAEVNSAPIVNESLI